MKTFYKNQICYLEIAIINIDGDFVTFFESGEEVTYIIKKSSDGSIIEYGEMTIEGNTWKVAWTPLVVGEYRVEYTTPFGYEDGMETIMIEDPTIIEGNIEAIKTETDKIKYILGLSQENYRIFNPVYNINYGMTSAIIKTYASASDCNTDTAPIATYQLIAGYDNHNQMTSYKVVKI